MDKRNKNDSINKEQFYDLYHENFQEQNIFNSTYIYDKSESSNSEIKFNTIYSI